jgi:hypothetical protein
VVELVESAPVEKPKPKTRKKKKTTNVDADWLYAEISCI